MSVDLQPAELGFRRPFDHEVSQILRLHNPNTDPVAFKVKTTAPKQYCVRPNSGRIEAGRDVEVQVLLQAMREQPPPDARCRDKFLVQSVAVSAANDTSNVSQIWANIEQTARGSIQEKKIRVNWLPSETEARSGTAGAALNTAATTTNGIPHHDDEPPAYSSPAQSAVTPQRQTQPPPTMFTPAPSEARDVADSTYTVPSETAPIERATAAVASVTGLSQDDLKRQLDAAHAQIKQLQQQVADGLRSRKPVAEGGEKSTTSSATVKPAPAPAPNGVPVHIVAALCLLCFLIAWLFF